jgi:hypothetical protein
MHNLLLIGNGPKSLITKGYRIITKAVSFLHLLPNFSFVIRNESIKPFKAEQLQEHPKTMHFALRI